MSRGSLVLFTSIFVCGCAAGTPKFDQGTALEPVREAHHNYSECLKQSVKPYLETKLKPKDIAGTVAGKCEPKLTFYKAAVREFFVKGLSPDTDGYSHLLVSKPETHANRVRERGRRATMARVLNARKPAKSRAKGAPAGEASAKAFRGNKKIR